MSKIKICLVTTLLLLTYVYSATSEACQSDSECMEMNYCNSGKCVHKGIFSDWKKEIIGMICIAIGSALSNAGGTGGGGLLIPILLLILKFYTHEAIPISKLMIFTGALTSFLLGFRQKHPFRNSITIDYDIPTLLVPMLLFGTMVGVTLNKVMPPWLILVCLTLVLVVNTYKTLKKARSLYMAENKNRQISSNDDKDIRVMSSIEETKMQQKKNEKENLFDLSESNEQNKHNSEIDTKGHNYSELNVSTGTEELLKVEVEQDLRKFPFDKVIYMIISYIVMLVVNFLKGSDYLKSVIGVQVCSLEYWVIYLLFFPYAFIMTYFIAGKIQRNYDYRVSIGYPYNSTDIKWNPQIFLKFPCYSFVSGLLAGLLGIGGGLIIGPLLLELGLHPVVSTATSNFLVLFTSSSTSIQFILLGMMNLDYGIACTVASTVGSFIGTLLIQNLLKKTGRNSYIVFVLGSVLCVSTILVPAHTVMQIFEKLQEGKSIWSFSKPC